MRPFIVLLLVLGALVAAFFAFTKGGPDDVAPAALSRPGGPAAVESAPDRPPLLEADAAEPGETSEPEAVAQRAAVALEGGPRNVLLGSVAEESGEPIEGASVTLTKIGRTTFFFADETSDRSADRTVKTDGQGQFRFENVEPYDGYALMFKHPDYALKEVGNVNIGQATEYREPTVVLETGSRLFGVVRDTGGNLVPDAKIFISPSALEIDPSGPDTLDTTSARDGRYEFRNVAEGNYTVQVAADGYGRLTLQQLAIAKREDVEHDFELEIALMLAGRVEAAGVAVPKALVQAFSLSQGGQQSRSQARTNERGEFSIEDIAAGNYTLLTRADGYKIHRYPRVKAGNTTVVIELTSLPRVEGTVVDAQTGKPLTNFAVRLREANDTVPLPVQDPTYRSGVQGTYVLFAPKGGSYVVEATADDYAGCFSDPFTVGEGQSLQGIVVRMTPGGTLRGRVVDQDGRPIVNALVATRDNEWTDDPFMQSLGSYYPTLATTREMRTNASGEFELAGLSATRYQVDVQHAEYSRTVQKDIDVDEGQEVALPDIVMNRGAVIRGMVYDPSGKALPGAVVQLTSTNLVDGFPLTYTAKTDSKGSYELKHVRGGSYSLKALRTAEATANAFQHWEDLKVTERRLSVSNGQEYNGEDFRLGARGPR